MMFIMTLLLMDSPSDLDHSPSSRSSSLRSSSSPSSSPPSPSTLSRRQSLNSKVHSACVSSPLYSSLSAHNAHVRNTTLLHAPDIHVGTMDDPDTMLRGYPMNASGYYRGHWSVKGEGGSFRGEEWGVAVKLDGRGSGWPDDKDRYSASSLDGGEEPHYGVPEPSASAAYKGWDRKEKALPLMATGGRVAMQLYSKRVAGLPEVSLVRGLVKMYDGDGGGTKRDVLLYVVGVGVGKVGAVSLVANWGEELEGYFMVEGEGKEEGQRSRRIAQDEKVGRMIEEAVGRKGDGRTAETATVAEAIRMMDEER